MVTSLFLFALTTFLINHPNVSWFDQVDAFRQLEAHPMVSPIVAFHSNRLFYEYKTTMDTIPIPAQWANRTICGNTFHLKLMTARNWSEIFSLIPRLANFDTNYYCKEEDTAIMNFHRNVLTPLLEKPFDVKDSAIELMFYIRSHALMENLPLANKLEQKAVELGYVPRKLESSVDYDL